MSNTIDPSRVTGSPLTAAQLAEQLTAWGKQFNEQIPGAGESLRQFASFTASSLKDLPTLPAPVYGGGAAVSMGGLSLETLLDAVGFEQRRTETKAGVANMEAHAQERAEVNQKKLELVQENLAKAGSQKVLNGFLKAFKIIGMVLAAVASVAMIAAGAVGLAAGGSGAALIAVGVASMVMLASSITESATDGKAGFGPGFIAGKIAEAAGADENAVMWTKMAVDLLATIVMTAATFGASGASAAGNAANAAAGAAGNAAKTASGVAQAGDKLATAQKVANVTARAASIGSGINGIAQGAAGIANAVNERDISYLAAQRKRLDAILQRISVANELDLDHLKTMMQRTEQTLQTVSDIVKEGAQANIAVTTGRPPAMA